MTGSARGHDEWADLDSDGPDDADGTDADPRVVAGVEHLQRAAREAIAATRALLDVAEELVEDPRAVRGVMGAFGSFASAAGGLARRGGPWDRDVRADDGDDRDDGEDPGVQRIPVS